MPIGKNKTRLTVTLDKSTAQDIEDMAAKEKRSGSAMLAILIDEALHNRKRSQNAYIRGPEYYAQVFDRVEQKDENPDGKC